MIIFTDTNVLKQATMKDLLDILFLIIAFFLLQSMEGSREGLASDDIFVSSGFVLPSAPETKIADTTYVNILLSPIL